MFLRLFLPLFLLCLVAPNALAGVEQLPEAEFRKLAADLAPKVNLFREAWAKDPAAQFYGGTTRDFLYWLEGKFREARTKKDAVKVAKELRARPVIDVREFIIGDSDVDIFAPSGAQLDPQEFGVRKIDVQKMDVLDPATELGKNEVNQGFLPAEKIRLGPQGLATSPELGDGVHEIYAGRLTVHFADPETFAKSKYAAEGINHPILLALRYLRLQAINYFQENGGGVAKAEKLLAGLDAESAAAVRKVIEKALDGKELEQTLAKPQFAKWINAAIQKAFRSYTNPDAARILMNEFRVTELPPLYPKIEPVNQYVFAKHRDEAAVAGRLKAAGLDPAKLYAEPAREFSDGFLYHGTRTEPAFRGILFQGVMSSESGSGGAGLYGVAQEQKAFAEKWGGDRNRLLRFPVQADAKIVDLTQGEGERAWEAFVQTHGKNFEAFAEEVGADILRYPYETKAYVVKNSGALGRAQGVYREILPLPELMQRAATLKTYPELSDLLSVNGLSRKERDLVAAQAKLPPEEIERAFKSYPRLQEEILRDYFPHEPFSKREDLVLWLLDQFSRPKTRDEVMEKPLPVILDLIKTASWRDRETVILKLLKVGAEDDQIARIRTQDRTVAEQVVQHLADPETPYLPKVWREVQQRVPSYSHISVFQNPAYERDGKIFHSLLLGAKDRSEVVEAVDTLKSPHWTKHPDWALDFLNANPRPERMEFLGTQFWNEAQPEFCRKQVKRLLQDPMNLVFLWQFLWRSWAPIDEEGLATIVSQGGNRTDDVLSIVFKLSDGAHRNFLIDGLLKYGKIEDSYLRALAGRLPPQFHAEVRRRIEAGIFKSVREKKLSLTGVTMDYSILYSLGGPSPKMEKLVDKLALDLVGNPLYAQIDNGINTALFGSRRNDYEAVMQEHFERWNRQLPTDPDTQKIFTTLLNQPHATERWAPWVESALALPTLPAELRTAAERYTTRLLETLAVENRALMPELHLHAYRLLEAQPKLRGTPKMQGLVRKWFALNEQFGGPPFAGAALALDGKFPRQYAGYLEKNRAALEAKGIAVPPLNCDLSFHLVGGAKP